MTPDTYYAIGIVTAILALLVLALWLLMDGEES